MSQEVKRDEELIDNYNQGRLEGDRKWIEAINERIAELEKLVGIPELRRLRERTRYRWDDKNIAEARSKRMRRRK